MKQGVCLGLLCIAAYFEKIFVNGIHNKCCEKSLSLFENNYLISTFLIVSVSQILKNYIF